ncbi:hypothetical protein AC1031_010285 [Aphanomyces cochlioides]|nr:hypothetical protein AC1031_010285 [Aphanomyces cochlioides]
MMECKPFPAFSLSSLTFPSKFQAEKVQVAPFLVKLREMLTFDNAAIFRWNDHGTALEIVDMALFVQIVLPKYFKQTKYSSFQRQLNYFGFHKWTKRRAHLCTFSNKNFIRDDPSLAALITRKRGCRQEQVIEPLPADAKITLTWDDVDWFLGLDYIADCLDGDANAWV